METDVSLSLLAVWISHCLLVCFLYQLNNRSVLCLHFVALPPSDQKKHKCRLKLSTTSKSMLMCFWSRLAQYLSNMAVAGPTIAKRCQKQYKKNVEASSCTRGRVLLIWKHCNLISYFIEKINSAFLVFPITMVKHKALHKPFHGNFKVN